MRRLSIVTPTLMLVIGFATINFPTTRSAQDSEPLTARNEMQKNRDGQVSIKTKPNGELTDAWYRSGNSTIRVSVRKEKTAEAIRGGLLFAEGSETFLRITADIIRRPRAGSLVQTRLMAIGKGVDYSILMDISSTTPDRASVQIKSGQQIWKGTFDFNKRQAVGLSGAPGLQNVLPAETKRKIGPLIPPLNKQPPGGPAAATFIGWGDVWDGLMGTVGIPPGLVPPPRVGDLCRAGCAAGAAALGVTCCAYTAGVGCVLCSAVVGGMGSLCTDACPN